MSARLPIHRDGEAVVVRLPRPVRTLVASVADAVRRGSQDPASPGYRRLFVAPAGGDAHGDGPEDRGHDRHADPLDDPLVTLRRQLAIDELCDTVARTVSHKRLNVAEADAWVRVLGLGVALAAADAGIDSEDDARSMGPELATTLDLLRTLQLLLAVGIDPALDDLVTPGT